MDSQRLPERLLVCELLLFLDMGLVSVSYSSGEQC